MAVIIGAAPFQATDALENKKKIPGVARPDAHGEDHQAALTVELLAGKGRSRRRVACATCPEWLY
jgi:hypothetical protein